MYDQMPMSAVVDAMMTHDSEATLEFLSRQDEAAVESFMSVSRVIEDGASAAMLRDPEAFMRFKCPDPPPPVDKAVFKAATVAAQDNNRPALDQTLEGLSLEQLSAIGSLCASIRLQWNMRRPAFSVGPSPG